MDDLSLELKLEGILFYKGTPLKKANLLKLFSITEEDLEVAIKNLSTHLEAGATRLIETESEIQVVTAPQLDSLIEELRRDELKRDIGKAGAETLAIILYKGPVTRPEIDRIRGVNSAFILRNLLVRGLIERTQTGKTYTFDITPALLAHLGVSKKHDLPQHSDILDQLETFEKEVAEAENT